jgi:phage recombination protein Bet
VQLFTTVSHEEVIMADLVGKKNTNKVLPREKYDLAKSLVAKGASDAEFELLIHIADKYKLDPLLKEIWFIKRKPNEPPIIMTSRDGYLAIAHRSSEFDGMQSGTTEDENGKLIKAWCEVWRKDMSHSFKSEVKFSEYVQPSYIWQKYPSAMLMKVAEVFALKRAFSISGMLTQEEMGYSDMDGAQEPVAQEDGSVELIGVIEPKQTMKKQKEEIFRLGRQLGLDRQTTRETVEVKYRLGSFDDLSDEQANDAIKALNERLQARQQS